MALKDSMDSLYAVICAQLDVFLHAKTVLVSCKKASDLHPNCPASELALPIKMGRRRTENPEELLCKTIILRVTEEAFNKLEKLCKNSDCNSMAEVLRRIIDGQRIILFHKDASLDEPMEILAQIRKELNHIGTNINQITRNFNACKTDTHKIYHIQKAQTEYQKVDTKVILLLKLISQLSKKWLQR